MFARGNMWQGHVTLKKIDSFFQHNISGYNEHSQAHVNLNTGKSEEAKLLTSMYVEVIGTD